MNTLSNGLRYTIIPKKNIESVSILVIVYVGSRNENTKYSGISHLLEHMLFRGTKKHKTGSDVFKELTSIGSVVNAYTNSDQTGYYIKTSKNNLKKAIESLSDMIFNSKLEPKSIEKEKTIIFEEINMHKNNPKSIALASFDDNIFEGHSLSNSVAGTSKSLNKITPQILKDYYNSYYYPENMILVISGNVFAPNNLEDIINKNFNKQIKHSSTHKKLMTIYNEYIIKNVGWRLIYNHFTAKQENLIIGFPTFGYHSSPNRYILEVINVILGGNASSRLFTKIREHNGHVYNINSVLQIYEDNGFIYIKTMVENKNIEFVIIEIIKILKQFKTECVSDEELINAKTSIEGSVLIKSDDTLNTALFYGIQLLYNQPLMIYNEYINEIKKVKKEDIKLISEIIFDFNNMLVCIVGESNKDIITKLINKLIK